MLKMILVVFVAAAWLPAHAQVFKCQEGGKTVFSDRPCGASAAAVDVKPASGEYNAVDGMRARSRALDGEEELLRMDAERARNRSAATIDSEISRKAGSERCAQVRKEKAKAQYWAKEFKHPDNIKREQEKVKELTSREFFDCQ